MASPARESSLLWALIGAGAGYVTRQLSPRPTEPERERRRLPPAVAAVGWAFTTAAWVGCVWAGACLIAEATLGVSAPFVRFAFENLLLLTALGAVYGGLAGALVGLCARSGERRQTTLTLGIGGAAFGALAGAIPVLTLAATAGQLHPLLSSSLAMAVVGFFAGLLGYRVSRRPTEPDEPPDEEEEPDSPQVKIEWLLREEQRPWRICRPLVRVLPVLVIAFGSLVGASFVTSQAAFALLAVALLGLAVAWALYRQEQRLDALEARSRGKRDTGLPL